MCHNPTGADLTNDQWDAVIEISKPASLSHSLILPIKDLVPVGRGCLRHSRHCQRWITRSGGNSFSKIFSLYGERVGGLSVCVKMPKLQAAYWGN